MTITVYATDPSSDIEPLETQSNLAVAWLVKRNTLSPLDLDNHIAVLDMHRKRLRHVRPFRQRFAVLDRHRIGPDLDALGVEPGLAGTHVELPAVPGAAQEFAD